MRILLLLLILASGLACNVNSGEQAAVRLSAQTQADLTASITSEIQANVDAAFAKIDASLQDQSRRVTETTQQAVLAISKVDNSTSDKVVNRLLVSGVVIVLVVLAASYPVGKILWLLGARIGSGKRRARHS